MAADVEGFIEDHKLSHPVLIGHSMYSSPPSNNHFTPPDPPLRGAKTAMALSLQDPSLISALVSVDNAPLDAALPSSFPAYISGMRTIEASSTTRQRDADAILATHEPSLPIRQFLLTNLHRPSPSSPDLKFRIPIDVLARALDHMADFPFKDPAQVRYDGPTLFVRGTRSRYVADDALPLVGAFFPRFELRDVEAGHWLISENPEGFRRAVVEFLEDKG
ncbi:MAG: hypothetical protein M1832_005788 [Thelocarpon impressellum]|nr:MAG: hypothetical protein M1832_005788 [Thelocarpon impressellum]